MVRFCKFEKLMALLLMLLMLFALSACKNDNTNASTDAKDNAVNNTTESKVENAVGNIEIEIESCSFANEVRALDGEYAGTLYEKIDGKIYVDVIAVVNNKSNVDFNQDNVSGYVTYEDLRYDFQYCSESYTSSSVDSDVTIPPNMQGRIHLYTRLPAEAENQSGLIAHVIINGEEQDIAVEAMNNSDPLSRKTQLHVGDKVDLMDGTVEFEVIDCVRSKYLRASDYANSKQYGGTNTLVDVILKIDNNLAEGEITDIFGYTKIGDEIILANVRIETENHTDLGYISSVGGVVPGKSEYIHVYSEIDEETPDDEAILRFNFGGNCYYIKPSN